MAVLLTCSFDYLTPDIIVARGSGISTGTQDVSASRITGNSNQLMDASLPTHAHTHARTGHDAQCTLVTQPRRGLQLFAIALPMCTGPGDTILKVAN